MSAMAVCCPYIVLVKGWLLKNFHLNRVLRGSGRGSVGRVRCVWIIYAAARSVGGWDGIWKSSTDGMLQGEGAGGGWVFNPKCGVWSGPCSVGLRCRCGSEKSIAVPLTCVHIRQASSGFPCGRQALTGGHAAGRQRQGKLQAKDRRPLWSKLQQHSRQKLKMEQAKSLAKRTRSERWGLMTLAPGPRCAGGLLRDGAVWGSDALLTQIR